MSQLWGVSDPVEHMIGTCRLLLADKVASMISRASDSHKLPHLPPLPTTSPPLCTLGAPVHPPVLLQSLLPTPPSFSLSLLPFLASFLSPSLSHYCPFSYLTPSSVFHLLTATSRWQDYRQSLWTRHGYCWFLHNDSFSPPSEKKKPISERPAQQWYCSHWHNSDDKIKAIQVTPVFESQDKEQRAHLRE